ncbi:MAG TPA: hypothetical protein VLE97_06430 [Gaiellaceae bacterium]|nr:hypothetical protein [Gaiellaceae bacterium]
MSDKPDKPDKRERFAELLGTTSKNFLGTGLTMDEFMQLHRAEQLAASWALQPPEDKKRRRRAVIRLCQELGRIEETVQFSTGLAELAIEAVIEGDWKMVAEWAEHLTFAKEFPVDVVDGNGDKLGEKYAAVFAVFRELLLQVLRGDKEMPA